jgi:hypothetical protein
VPGIQIDGYFHDTSTANTHERLVPRCAVRDPPADNWNGKLVITGAPGIRKQYANDYLLSDWFVARGYAYRIDRQGQRRHALLS